jgi:hypothetical protein
VHPDLRSEGLWEWQGQKVTARLLFRLPSLPCSPVPCPLCIPSAKPPLCTERLGSPGLRRPRALESQRESKGIGGPLLFASQGMTTMVRPMAMPAAGAMSHRTERAIEVHTPAFTTIPWECPPGVVRKCAVSLVDAAASANMSRSCRSQSAGRHRDRAC